MENQKLSPEDKEKLCNAIMLALPDDLDHVHVHTYLHDPPLLALKLEGLKNLPKHQELQQKGLARLYHQEERDIENFIKFGDKFKEDRKK